MKHMWTHYIWIVVLLGYLTSSGVMGFGLFMLNNSNISPEWIYGSAWAFIVTNVVVIIATTVMYISDLPELGVGE